MVDSAEGSKACPERAWDKRSAGVQERGHVRKGRPGTWESSSHSIVAQAARAPPYEVVQAPGDASPRGSEERSNVMVTLSEGNEARCEGG